MSTLPIKIAVALSGAIVGYGLAAFKYVADVEPYPELAASIGTMSTMLPAIFALLSIIAIQFYRHTDDEVGEMREVICGRRPPGAIS